VSLTTTATGTTIPSGFKKSFMALPSQNSTVCRQAITEGSKANLLNYTPTLSFIAAPQHFLPQCNPTAARPPAVKAPLSACTGNVPPYQ
jgi:hypothetical protein